MFKNCLAIIIFAFVFQVLNGSSAGNLNNLSFSRAETNTAIYQNDTIEAFLNNYLILLLDKPTSIESGRAYQQTLYYLKNTSDSSDYKNLALAERLGGYYQFSANKFDSSIDHYNNALYYYKKLGLIDSEISAGPYMNIGLAYQSSNRVMQSIEPITKALDIRESIYGKNSIRLLGTLLNLSAIYISVFDYEKASEYAIRGIDIIEDKKDGYNLLSKLLLNAGITYKERGDSESAELFFQRARTSYFEHGELQSKDLIFIYNSLGAILGEKNKKEAIDIYLEAVRYIDLLNIKSLNASSVFSNLAFAYAKEGDLENAELYFNRGLKHCEINAGKDAVCYLQQLENLAYFYNTYLMDFSRSYDIYSSLYKKLDISGGDPVYRYSVAKGYADLLVDLGLYSDARQVLCNTISNKSGIDNKLVVNLYVARGKNYYNLYLNTDSLVYLESSISDYKQALDIVDFLKIDLSAEGGRLNVTEKYDYILNRAILSASEMYRNCGDDKYLQLALNYSERAKASTLLASTRESKVIKFHIPDSLARKERELSNRLNQIEAKIFEESNKVKPDSFIINQTEALKLSVLIERDKLIKYLELNYPDYYNLKHNEEEISLIEIERFTGKKANFVEYYLTDTLLYSFIINSKYNKMLLTEIDSSFYSTVRQFRQDIVKPLIEDGSREQFKRITNNGYYLYNILIKPLEDYMISDRLIIANDDILSYLPFETLISDTSSVTPLYYRNLHFLFKDYDMEYVYSASLLLENSGKERRFGNNALVFAPYYNGTIELDSLLLSRQPERGKLTDIPGAKEEAIYVSSMLGGKLFIDNDALESRFKQYASESGIIHLAMHTLLNDSDPMFSKMVFSSGNDMPEDGMLNTYEVYNLDLNASMVVLSSCNTGSGIIRSGEGVISLARGFMYAGVPSVVMSLWEVDDYSGTEIIKMFYKYLRKGYNKSKALQKARENYLKETDQLRSHPYFWCSLVILGDDEAIFHNKLRSVNLVILSLLLLASLVYRIKVRNPRNL